MGIQTARDNLNPGQSEPEPDISHLLPQGEIQPMSDSTTEPMDEINIAFFAKYQKTIDQAPKVVQTMHTRMQKYESLMGPNCVIHEQTKGAEHQVFLFNTFMRALGERGENLFMCVDVILAHINQHIRSTFSDTMAFRFIRFIKRDRDEVNTYCTVFRVLLQIAPPTTRMSAANSPQVKNAVGNIDPRYREAAFALVTYLSQYKTA